MDRRRKTEVIALYLQGGLEGKELEDFRQALASDQNLRLEVELQKRIIGNVVHAGRHELKAKLKQYHQELMHETDLNDDLDGYEPTYENNFGVASRKYTAWLAAATVTVACCVVGLGYYFSLSGNKIFKEAFTPYALRTTRTANVLPEMISLYKTKHYDQFLSSYQKMQSASLQETFLAGNVYLIKGQAPLAIACFRKVINQNEYLPVEDRLYYDDAQYFLGLAYLKAGRIREAEELLEKIKTSALHAYHDQVGEWLLFKIRLVDKQ